MHGRRCVWQGDVHAMGACMAGGARMAGGLHGRRPCMVGGVHGRGACMAGGKGACMAGETATAADGMHPIGMHSCSKKLITLFQQLIETLLKSMGKVAISVFKLIMHSTSVWHKTWNNCSSRI